MDRCSTIFWILGPPFRRAYNARDGTASARSPRPVGDPDRRCSRALPTRALLPRPPHTPSSSAGLTALHNFEYEEANAAFLRAQQIDRGFAMAYWGEAMTYHQILWQNEDVAAGRRALLAAGADAGGARGQGGHRSRPRIPRRRRRAVRIW